jgi:hypothetical protein
MIHRMAFRRKRDPTTGPTQAEIDEVMRHEVETLKDYFARMRSVGDDPGGLWAGVEQLMFANGPREVMTAIETYPELLTERGAAVLDMTEVWAQMVGLPFAPGVIADRRAWLERTRAVRPDA